MFKSLKKFPPYIFLIGLLSCSNQQEVDKNVVHILDSPTKGKSAEPFLFANQDELLLSWVQHIKDSTYTTNYSRLTESSWSEGSEMARGNNWFVNWADFPSIAKNGSGTLLSHFLQKSSPGTYSYDVMYKIGIKDSSFNSQALLLNKDSTLTEHGFVTTVPASDSTFFITWLDGRNTIKESNNPAMSIRAAKIHNDGSIHHEMLLDARTCDCCQTSAAITKNGPVVVYRDRSEDEIRDISIVREVDGVWTTPKSIYNDNWKVHGCPVNGPRIDVHQDRLAVAWFTGAHDSPQVNLSFSFDEGKTFQHPIKINEGAAIGRVDLDFAPNGQALVSWIESNEKGTFIRVTIITPDQTSSAPLSIAKISSSRSSGFPQIEVWQDKLYFAYTEVIGEQTEVKTGFIPLTKFPGYRL